MEFMAFVWNVLDWALPARLSDVDKAGMLALFFGGLGCVVYLVAHKAATAVAERWTQHRTWRRLALRPKQHALLKAGAYRR